MEKLKRKSYDTRIKYLARQGLLPKTYQHQIHRSLVCKWKQEPKDKYVGYDLNENMAELYDAMKALSDDQRFRKVVISMYRINKVLRDIIGQQKSYIRTLKSNKAYVVRTIEQAGKTITINNACRLLEISPSTYRVWAKEVYFKCNNSLLKLCSSNYPKQLAHPELQKMYRMFVDPQFLHWPVKSVAYYGIKHGIVKAHINTWYKYFRLMNIERLKIRKQKRKYKEGVRAKAPNEKWHADITEITLLNGQTAYIYLVIDNYSRFILSWRASLKKCAKIRLETFKEAIIRSRLHGKRSGITELIVDGGTENNNQWVEDYLQENKTLKKLIALKDILKSNAMAEYTNRVLKYEYLYTRYIYNDTQLQGVMKNGVFDFNYVRPQGVLLGLSPYEAYMGECVNPKERNRMFKGAQRSRVHYNRTHKCKGCPFGCKK